MVAILALQVAARVWDNGDKMPTALIRTFRTKGPRAASWLRRYYALVLLCVLDGVVFGLVLSVSLPLVLRPLLEPLHLVVKLPLGRQALICRPAYDCTG